MTKQNQDTGKNLVLNAALDALARGWSVMPISRTSKNPLVKWSGYTEEMPGLVKVKNWFGADYPDANLGLITGELSQVVVLDCDDETGLEEIERRGGVPETLMVQTRPDIAHKLHFYFQHPGFAVGNFQKKCGEEQLPGLDFRGDGGYVMLPPSVHHSGAGNYTWLNDFPIAPCPKWLTDVLRNREVQEEDNRETVPIPSPDHTSDRSRKYVLSALEKEREKMLACGHGERHTQRYNSAMALAGYIPLLSEQEIIDALSVNFGKDKKGALDTIADGISNGKAKPRQLPANVVNGTNYNGAVPRSATRPQKPKESSQQEIHDLESPPAAPAIVWDTRTLEERGLTDATLRHFNMTRCKRSNLRYDNYDCYEYPTWTSTNKPKRLRQFVLDPSTTGGKRYFSAESGDASSLPTAYNLQSAAQRLGEGALDVWITDSELSTWFVHQAGLIGVNPFNLSADPTNLVKELKKLGAMRLQLVFGSSESGAHATRLFLDAAGKAGLACSARGLVGPAGYTVADLYARCDDDESFVAAMRNLTVVDPNKVPDKEPSKEGPQPTDAKGEKAVKLLDLLEQSEGLELFHTEDGDSYVALSRFDHIETYPINDNRFAVYCRHLYHQRTRKIIDGGTIDNVLGVLEGKAFFENAERVVPVRTGDHEGHIYIDLCDDEWRCVEIGPESEVPGGWRVVNKAPVRFRRAPGMKALPVPQRGGNWKMLSNLINAEDQSNWLLLVSWLVAAFRPAHYPYPVLAVHGEQESGKSTICRIAKKMIDPNYSSLINSREIDRRDLAIQCKNSFVIGFDNLSRMSQDVNDALCSLVTESCFRTRKLQSNDQEVLFRARRPIVLNGINENLGENDMRRRCLKLHLPPFSSTRSKDSEEEVDARFEKVWPLLLGLIFDAISVAMTYLPAVELPHRRGLLDFARWICAAEPALPWKSGEFAQTYLVNLQESIEAANEADLFALNIIDFIDQKGKFRGTASQLSEDLKRFVGEEITKDKSWPTGASQFGFRLNQVAPNLRAVGIEISREKSKKEGRKLTIRRFATVPPARPDPDEESDEETTETEAEAQEATS